MLPCEKVYQLLEAEPSLQNKVIAERLGLKEVTVRHAATRWRAKKGLPLLRRSRVPFTTPSITVAEIADALLKRAVLAIDSYEFQESQLKIAKKAQAQLQERANTMEGSYNRLLRQHNDYVLEHNRQQVSSRERDMAEVSRLMQKAKLRPEDGD